MQSLPKFRPGQDAETSHRALKKSVAIMDRAHLCAVLWFGEIMRRRLHRKLGYSTMRAYALEELGFSATRAGDSWVDEAKKTSRRELINTIKQARSVAKQERRADPDQGELVSYPQPNIQEAVVPVRLAFELTPGQAARYEAMLAKIAHRGSKAELLLDMVEAFLVADDIAPRGATAAVGKSAPHYQIHVRRCPDCERSSVQTPQGERELAAVEAEAAHCDALINKPGERNTSTIPPKIRREVLARDRHRCRRKGCQNSRYLHLHHLTPRALGGGNKLENLVTLCTACHALWHAEGGHLPEMLREVENT